MNLLKLCLIGTGYWGMNILRNLQKFEGIAISIVEPDIYKWSKIRGDIDFFESIDEALKYEGEIDAAVVCSPVSTHYEITKKLLEHKIHTLCQKPLVETVAQAEELTLLAKQNGVKLQTAFTYVYHPVIRKISESLPEIGRRYYYDSTRINLGLIQRDCNIIHDLFCHDAAILYYLTYKLPEYISATGESHNKNGFVDVANVSMGYENGFVAHCHVNWLSPIKNRTIILAGENKMVTFDDCSNEKLKIYDTGFAPKGDVFDYRTGDVLIPKVDNTEAIHNELSHFFESVRHGMEPLTNGEFSINVLKMVEAANLSIQKCGAPIMP